MATSTRVAVLVLVLCALFVSVYTQFINEIHYNNHGPDVNRAVEIAAPVGTNLKGWSLVFYSKSVVYKTVPLSGTVPDLSNGWGFLHVPVSGMQNRVNDGVALVRPDSEVVEFLSYEGEFLAKDGPAKGRRSVDIGVREDKTTEKSFSLQRHGVGTSKEDFHWVAPAPATFGGVNHGQIFDYGVFINELHYDKVHGDQNEAVEIAARAGTDLSNWSIVFYSGRNGLAYKTAPLDGVIVGKSNGWGFRHIQVSGIQNGENDGIALVRSDGEVVEFLSYEGRLVARDGPAATITSTNIGVSEDATTPADYSLQRVGAGNKATDFRWAGPSKASFGEANKDQMFLGSAMGTPPSQGGNLPGNEQTPSEETVKIYEIQGRSHTSPYDGRMVTVKGVVTAVSNVGFYVQDPDGDDDEATSDGIFVYTVGSPSVKTGDSVLVSGQVNEYIPGGIRTRNLGITQLRAASNATVLSSGNPLPEPVTIGSAAMQKDSPIAGVRVPPTSLIDDDAFGVYEPANDAIDFFESLEGMRVRVRDPVTISKPYRGSVWVLVDNAYGAGERRGLRGSVTIAKDEFNPDKIKINPNKRVFAAARVPDQPPGARLNDIIGVVSYSRGSFQVIPTQEISVVRGSILRPQNTKFSPPSGTRLLVATMNVLNLDLSDGPQRFNALGNIIANRLATPDVVALQEVQDNDGRKQTDVVSASEVLATLTTAIRDAGGPQYTALDNTFIVDDQSGGQPGGNIRVTYLYNSARVTLVPGSLRTIESPAFRGSRPPLVAKFRLNLNDGEFTVVNVHFSSKGGSAPDFGVEQPFEKRQDDPSVNSDVDDRLAQATAVREFLRALPTQDRESTIVTGDFNEFEFNTPMQKIVDGVPELTVLTDTVRRSDRFTYNFNGNAQVLDHFIAAAALKPEVDIVHINTEFIDAPSDHDPVLLQFQIDSAPKSEL